MDSCQNCERRLPDGYEDYCPYSVGRDEPEVCEMLLIVEVGDE